MTLVGMRSKEASVYGYCLGYVAQGGTYNFMSAYFVLFLTNCVGMESSIAGTIASIALFAEVIAGIIVGNISDNCKLRMGRRRPFILVAAICMPIILLMISQTIKTYSWIYYLFFAVAFRIVFSTFEIPNNALGAEIATGYDERTALRTRSRVFSIIGNAIGYVLPLLILSHFADNQQRGWQVIGIILASVALISWFGSFIITGISGADKNVNLHKDNGAKGKGNILKNYYELVKLKPVRLLIIYKSAFSCAFALFNVSTIYYLSYCQNLKNDVSAYIWIYNIVIFVAMTPIVNKMALKYGKTNQQIITMRKQGIRLAAGSDLPIESVNPFDGIQVMVTRRDLNGNPKEGWYPEEKFSRLDAVKLHTSFGAYASKEEDNIGTLELGKRANFVVVSDDVFEVPEDEIHEIKVLKTYIDADCVYEK